MGIARAEALATTLRDAGISAIITTELRRARDTAQPLATALGIKPEIVSLGDYDAAAHPQAVAAAVRRHNDENVLVVGDITVTESLPPWAVRVYRRFARMFFPICSCSHPARVKTACCACATGRPKTSRLDVSEVCQISRRPKCWLRF